MEAFNPAAAGVSEESPAATRSGPATHLSVRILEASSLQDPAGVRVGLDEAADALGLAGCIDDVLLPVLRQIGRWWAAGRCDPAQERTTTEAARAWIDRRSAFAPPPRFPEPILLACGPRDQHTVGLESLALLLRFQGWPCRVLGARVSVFDLVTATRATEPAAVVVVSHLEAARSHAITAISEIDRLGRPVFYAGTAFRGRSGRSSIPGEYLGTSIGGACLQLCRQLPPS